MIWCFTAVSAVVPSLLLVWYFHKRDVFPEPPRVLWATFGLGVLIVFPVILVELAIDAVVGLAPDAVLRGALDAFFVAAFTEESFKLLALMTYVWRHREFNEPMDGIVYGVVASLGFATLENILYVFQGGIGLAIMRALTAVPAHATMGAVMGYFVGQAKFARSGRAALALAGFGAAFMIHGFYDFPLLSIRAGAEIAKATGEEAPETLLLLLPCTLIALGFSTISALLLTRRLRRKQLKQKAFARAAAPAEGHVHGYNHAPLPHARPYPSAPAVVPVAPRPPPVPARGFAAPPVRPGRTLGLVLLAVGATLGSAGGMMTLAVAAAFFFNPAEQSEVMPTLIGTAVIGVLPMVTGAVAFTAGIIRLNQRT